MKTLFKFLCACSLVLAPPLVNAQLPVIGGQRQAPYVTPVISAATINTIIANNTITANQLQYLTNAFPLTAGTTWTIAKNYQNIITNNDFAITAIAGLTNNAINWSILEVSNSAAATHFCDLSSLPWHVIGSSSTNKVYIGAGKVAFISSNFRGVASSNLVTAVEP